MAKIGVSLKIDVTKIDKARLFKGAKGTYLDATVFVDIDELDQYGNSGMITQVVTKEEKAQGVKGNILGNCKVFWSEQQPLHNQAQNQSPAQRPPVQQQGNAAYQAPQQGYAPAPQQQGMQMPADDGWQDDIPFAPIGLQYGRSLIHSM